MAPLPSSSLHNLKGRVIVVTGGAQGIGAATVYLLHSLGAHVVFGDIATSAGQLLESTLSSPSSESASSSESETGEKGRVYFQTTDVTSYASQLVLFEKAFLAFGRVDGAITCAAVMEDPAWFSADISLDDVRAGGGEPVGISKMVTTNLVSPLLFTRLAMAFIRASPPFSATGNGEGAGEEESFIPSVTYTSSLAGLTPTPSPGMTVYSTTKHGLVGLTRSLPGNAGKVRFNAVCPSAADTGLLPDVVKDLWRAAGFRIQSPEAVAQVLVQCVADARLDRRTVVVAGGEAWEAEEELEGVRGVWLGEENAREVEESGAFFVSFLPLSLSLSLSL